MKEAIKRDWFNDNYIETATQIEFQIERAEVNHTITIHDLYEGCKALRLGKNEKELLETHIKLIANMVDVGINARIAGVKLREAFQDTEAFN